MGRPSKLSADQWATVERRLNAGESAASLSREYGVSEATLSQRFSKVSKDVRNAASLIAAGQNALAMLPVAQQYQAMSLADKLRNISNSLAHAAENGAATAHRLSAIANNQAQLVDDQDPMANQAQIQAIAALTKVANEAASLGLGLVNANKGMPDNEKPPSRVNMGKLSTAALEEILAARDGH